MPGTEPLSPDLVRRLAAETRPGLYAFARRLAGDEQLAHDVAQEAVLRAYTRLKRVPDQKTLQAWLFAVAGNLVRDAWRSSRRNVPIESVAHILPSRESAPDRLCETAELARLAEASIEKLPPDQKEAFRLRHNEEKSYREIAETQGVRLSTAKVRIHRARRRLRGALDAASGVRV